MNSRDRYEIIGFAKFHALWDNFVEVFAYRKHQKCIKDAETMQYLG